MANNKKKFKVITYIDRINILSDTFITYYLKFFNLDEFHFLILDSEFDLIRDYLLHKKFVSSSFEKVSNKYFGTTTDILDKQNEVANRFLNNNFIVVYVDIDEIIYHHDLRNYILNNIKDYITPLGVVIIPNSDEKYLDSNDKILSQRKYCIFDNTWHSKTCILNKNYTWSPGRHNKNSNKISDDIFIIDIGRCCQGSMLENNKRTNKIYKNVSFRYSTEDKTDIDKTISKLLPSLELLPEYISNTKLF
jgi:hypothetical protein